MALTEYTLTDAEVGLVLPITDGYLVNINQTQNQTRYEIPQWSEGTQRWLTSYFVLRGSADVRDAICLSPQTSSPPSGNPKMWLVNSSRAYRGDLVVVAVPRGSVWSVSVSDVPNPRAPYVNTDGANYGSYPDWSHTADWPRPPREPVGTACNGRPHEFPRSRQASRRLRGDREATRRRGRCAR